MTRDGSGRLEGKMALITGAASGLGKATAAMMAKEGARVALSDLNGEGVKAVAETINSTYPGCAVAFEHDVTREDHWKAVTEEAARQMGGLNVLINNAGIGGNGSVEDETFEGWRRVIAVDLDSVFLGCKFALPHMRPHAPGSIVNISSISGLIAGHNMAAYNAAKSGVWLLSKSVALHCAKRGYNIRCNSVHPTFIKTPILDPLVERLGKEEAFAKLSRQIPIGYLGEPDDVAYCIVYLASDESKFMTGAELKLDGGISAM